MKTRLLFFLTIVCISVVSLCAQNTLVEWNFDGKYEMTTDGSRIATPSEDGTFFALGDGKSTERFYQTYSDIQIADAGVLTAKGAGCYNSVQLSDCNNTATVRLYYAGQNNIADYSNAENHDNYFQFAFSTSGYQDITVEFSYAANSDSPTYLRLAYSTDNGASWIDGGENFERHANWWIFTPHSIELTGAKNKENVLVRLIGGNDATSANGAINMDYFRVSGDILSVPKEIRTVFESDFSDWTSVLSPLSTIPSYTGEILIDPTSNFFAGSPSESDQSGKYQAPCIVPYRTHYLALKKGAATTGKIGPIKNLRSFTFIEGNTGNSRGSTVSIIGKDEAVETPVLTQSINSYTGNAQGVEHTLDLVANNISYTNGSDKSGSSDFTFTDAQREEAYIIFNNWQPEEGADPNKDSYFFYMAIDAEVEITANQVSLTTAVSPANSGNIKQTPNGLEFDEGTSITLTAEPAFGYEFSKWLDDQGNELSANNPYSFDLDEDMNVVAEFVPKNIYSLQVNALGGNDYLVNISPKGELINGVLYYEEGAEIRLDATASIANNKLLTFTNWSDNSTEAVKVFTITENTQFTANYSAVDFIVGWDLHLDEPGGQRAADYKYDTENQGMLSIRKADGTTSTWLKKGISAGKYEGRYGAVNWRPIADKYYYEISFSTQGFSNVSVSAAMLYNYNAYSIQKVQYSVDGEEYFDLGNYSFVSAKTWYEESFNLPESVNGQSKVYVRFIPDYSSAIVGTESTNDGTAITDIYVIADSNEADDTVAPLLVSSIPENESEDITANGSVILTFDERVFAGNGNCSLNGEILEPVFTGKTVKFSYSGLAYNTPYTFTVPDGAILDKSGNAFEGCEITFTTMNKVQPSSRIYDLVVAADGSGDFLTVSEAIAYAPANRVSPYLIFIKEGIYNEHVEIPENKPYIHLIGQDVEKVTIADSRLSGDASGQINYHVSQGATVVVQAPNFFAENITFDNSWGVEKNAGPQALAMYSNNDRFVLNNCKLRSYQDTYLTSTKNIGDRHYLKNCFIEGAVDFIYGGGDVYFDECTLNIVRKSGGYIVAPSHKLGTAWGYVFMNNTITAPAPANETSVWLGRPWKDAPKAVYINTKAQVSIPAAGWHDNMGAIPAIFADYNTMDANGNPLDLSNRIEDYWYMDNGTKIEGKAKNFLTDEEAASYTVKNVLSGNDFWQPALLTEAVAAPVITGDEGTINWEHVPYAISYVIIKNGIVIDFVTDNTFTDEQGANADIYHVQAVNEYGGLSTISNKYIADYTGGSVIGNSESTLKIYANKGRIFVQNIDIPSKIQVYSLSGMLLKNFEVAENLDFSVLKGSYIVRVANAVNTKSVVLIVQ